MPCFHSGLSLRSHLGSLLWEEIGLFLVPCNFLSSSLATGA